MSYFSDIDLATLHQSRLNERIQYKLSWFNRRQKYYIPAPVNQRNNQKTSIKNQPSYKFSMDSKKPCKSINGTSLISEKKPLNNLNNNNNNNENNFAANKQKKNACVIKKTSSTNINSFNQKSNHCDNSTDVCVNIDEINTQKNLKQNNHSSTSLVKNQLNNVKKLESMANKHVQSSTISLASIESNSVENDFKHNAAHAKCLSGDAINKNAKTTLNDQMVNTTFSCNNSSTTDQQAIENLDLIPHRKRSGTWP